ncbi:D-amino acid aminotransferase [Azoarcus communis]|uniref:D-amino acid aminotransferase n=1 Tax=Parazoarcus communis SWub3 = DSM 12120 TaxID=1121029 RepID=A0A323V1E2_9RHOO|nr:D-amino acid aminotransferase [Parazoarcus communis]NMG47734.1 D-amino acid aminotransferase [Parazoarcus communis]NMG68783.1 D-amino acid aminotransferase [Parazoarcus communis SWub3 = DSM 12120]PZA17903.1 D-amino acid aminotransferase [Azoarcus communis] [Parazoarcus communis SWub3 = DSM 12120]
MSICYLNGRFLPVGEASVSPMDRGFLFGDGAYEVIPVYSRRPFRLDEHVARLANTLAAIRLPDPHSAEQWQAIIRGVIERNEWEDQSVYLQVSRGADDKRNHAFPKVMRPTVFLMSEPLVTPPEAQRQAGVAAVSAADFRWLRCDLKTVALLANCLLRQHAVDQGCMETILFRDGFLTEGAASNIFVVRDGVILTPPKSHLMLPGITYDVVLELAARHGLAHEVREILEDEVRHADELWMTSSTKEVLPITTLDGRPVGDGKPGPVGQQMHAFYQDFKNTVMRIG